MAAKRVSHRVPVWLKHTPSWCRPDFYTDRDSALQWVQTGQAKTINRGQGLRLLYDMPPMVRGASCHPKERHVVAYVDASTAGADPMKSQALALFEQGWTPHYTVGKEQQSLIRKAAPGTVASDFVL